MLNDQDRAEAVYRIQKAGYSADMLQAVQENRLPLDLQYADLPMTSSQVADFAEVIEKSSNKTPYGAIALNLAGDPAIGYLVITPQKAAAGDHEFYQDRYPYCLVVRLTAEPEILEGYLSLDDGKTRLYQIGSELKDN